jgi:hypothetical protein
MMHGSSRWCSGGLDVLAVLFAVASTTSCGGPSSDDVSPDPPAPIESARTLSPSDPNPVLDWNQVFIDTLIATGTANSASQRLGAIVHTAVFDAYNGIERRYTPYTPAFVRDEAPPGASRRAAVIAAAYTALVGLFPSRKVALDGSYTASLAALSDDGEDGGISRERGIAWGADVATRVLEWRKEDGFNNSYPSFFGGTEVGQWQPTFPLFGPMSAQGLAFTSTFFLESSEQFRPPSPRPLASSEYTNDFNTVKALGRSDGSQRTPEQTALAPFWEYNASVHWNQAANQIARADQLSTSESNRLLAMLNIAMADTAFTTWSAKRYYGAIGSEVTWRPVTAIPAADTDGNPDTLADAGWLPLINTPSHPEYPAGHPSQNGAAATVLLAHFGDAQTFELTAGPLPSRTYFSITQARRDGNDARVWGGMHFPSTVAASDAAGAAVASYVVQHAMQRVH